MEVAEGEGDLGRVELGLVLAEAFLVGEVLEEFSALNEVHYEVDSVALLEDVVEPNDEGMVHLDQNKFLQLQRLNALVLDHHVLPYHLHRE